MEVYVEIAALISFVFAILAFNKSNSIEREVKQLRRELDAVKSLSSNHAEVPVPVLGTDVVPPGVRPVNPQPLPSFLTKKSVSEPALTVASVVVPGPSTPLLSTVPDPPAGTSEPRQSGPSPFGRWLASMQGSDEWEAMIGGHWLNRIGAFALILGIAFFYKYAVDQNWISQSLRVAVGFLFGTALLGGAAFAHRKSYAIFSQGLVGAGTAALYLSIYASYNFYHLVPAVVALGATALVTALAFSQAVYYDSLAVAILAWLGGFITPLLLTLQQPDEVGLFAYLILLVTGILALMIRKDPWYVLEPPSIFATYGILALWYGRAYSERHLLLTAVLLSVMWVLFFAYDSYSVLRSSRRTEGLGHALGTFNGLAYYLFVYGLLEAHHRVWAAAVALALGAAYAATIVAIHRARTVPIGMITRYTITSIVFVVIATLIEASGFWTPVALSLQALILLACGIRWRLWYLWQPALGVFALATLELLAVPGALVSEHPATFGVVLNQRALAFGVLAATLGASAFLLRTLGTRQATTAHTMLGYGFCITLLVLVTVETNDLFQHAIARSTGLDTTALQYAEFVGLHTAWLLLCIPFLWVGLRRRLQPVLFSGLGILALAFGTAVGTGAAFFPQERFVPVMNIRAGSIALLVAVLGVAMRWTHRGSTEIPWLRMASRVCAAGILVILFELLTSEINDYFRHLGGNSIGRQGTPSGLFLELLILSGVWMAYSIPFVAYGLQKVSQRILWLGSAFAVLATVTGAYGSVAVEPGSEFGLFLGLRAVILTGLVAGLFLHLRLLRARRTTYPWVRAALIAIQAAIVLLGFELVTCETRDLFLNMIASASPHSSRIGHLRDLEQLTLSIVWLGYAIVLMALGLWRRSRWVRLGALGLLGLVILKIFVYDLSILAPAFRYISFAGLGVILLSISFLYQRYRSLLLEVV